MLCSRRFPAPSQNLTSSIIPLLILICNFFPSIHTQIQNDRRRGAKENKGTQFVISPRLPLPDSKQTQTYFCKCCSFIARHPSRDCFWSWSRIYCLWCLRCSPAVTGPQCLHSGYYFWLSLLHLGAQPSLFHFLCHNVMAKKRKKNSLQGITLLETRITYVVSQTRPSSLFIPLVQMTSESASA